MKILLYGLNFSPEPTGIGKYSGEMVSWLSSAKHEVRVISAPPYYPAWAVSDGYRAWRYIVETCSGARVWRTPLWVPARPTGTKRLLHLFSFAFLSLPVLALQLFWRPDVIIVVAPAFACAPAGLLAARLCGAKSWLHIQDFEIDAAFRMKLLTGRFAEKCLRAIERFVLHRFDRVSTISHQMKSMLHKKGVPDSRAVLLPNWVDVDAITPMTTTSPYRAELKIPDDAVVALFSGSMAGKQGLELLPAVARVLASRLPGLVFVLCGDGICKPTIERDCAGLSNVRMIGLQPTSRLPDLLGMADIHLLPQYPEAADLVMPSKLSGMLATGKPVIATAHPGTELARVVGGCGKVVAPNDVQAFAATLVELVESTELRASLGAAARRHAEEYFARDRVLGDFAQALQWCVEEASCGQPEGTGAMLPPSGIKPADVAASVSMNSEPAQSVATASVIASSRASGSHSSWQ